MEPQTNYPRFSFRHLSVLFLVVLVAGLILIAAFGGVTYVVAGKLLHKSLDGTYSQTGSQRYSYTTSDGDACNVVIVPLDDELFASDADAQSNGGTAGNDVVYQIEYANKMDSIKGIILRVNSPGGSGVAGEMIANALKAAHKPTVALIQDIGDSAAYLASTGANTIIASAYSDVGDIGVTGSYVDNSGADTKAGDNFIQISAGKYKDSGNPDKPLTADEKQLLQNNVDEDYKTFVDEVAQNRNLSTTTVTVLADGSSLPGSVAITKGLVDHIGTLSTAESWIQGKLSDKDPVVLCQ